MKTFGPLYVHTLKYYHNRFLPVVEVGTTQETSRPYRKGKCLVFRFPWTKPGFVIGLFGKPFIDPDFEADVDDLFASILRANEPGIATEEIREW